MSSSTRDSVQGNIDAPPRIGLMGVHLHAVDGAGAIEVVRARLASGLGGWVVTPNLDILRQAQRDDWLRGVINHAELALADGAPLIWASRLMGAPLPERVAGSSLVWDLARAADEHGWRLFLLGGAAGAAQKASRRLVERYPGLVVAGTYCPPLGFEDDPSEMDRIRQALAASKADLVYVGLGCPKQERLIDQVRETLPNAWWLGIGISLSFIAGDVTRAPRWMQVAGLEWIHRLCQEPGRLARRYLVKGLPFAARLMIHAGLNRSGHHGGIRS